jgi:hypothetical protein
LAIAVLSAMAILASDRTEAQAVSGHPAIPAQALTDVQTRGASRIIVHLSEPVSAGASLATANVLMQRTAIASAQEGVLRRLRAETQRSARRFRYIPYMAIEVDAGELQILAASPGVASIAIDRVLVPTLAESAPLVGAPTAWAQGFTGAGWAVAVLDTGVDKTHPFLAGKVASEACFSSNTSISTSVCPGGVESSVAPDSGMPCPLSDCEHGTHVAGIAAGRGTSFSGIAKDASLIAVQVFSIFTSACGPELPPCTQAFTSDIISGLERVYELRSALRIAAVNLSLGGGGSTTACDGEPTKAIIDQLRAAGIATVVAAGNDGFTNALPAPACVSTAISVGSTTDGTPGFAAADQVSAFSNSSPLLKFWAPGEAITSSVPGGGFAAFVGTSMAAPHVAGAWAVLKQRNPSASVSDVENSLAGTGRPILDPRNGVTKPRINVAAALQALAPVCRYAIAPLALTFPRGGGSTTVSVATDPGCSWSASSTASFVAASCTVAGCSGGSVQITVSPNPTTRPRTGTILVAGVLVTITQQGSDQGDVDGDGRADLVWQNTTTGALAMWTMNGGTVLSTQMLDATVPDVAWHIAGTGDLDGDGFADLVWQHDGDGTVAAWFMRGTQFLFGRVLSIPQVADTHWRIRGVADFNGDGTADLVWQHETEGWLAVWLMSGVQVVGTSYLSVNQVDPLWKIAGAGDTDGDGIPEIVFQHQTQGWLAAWTVNGTTVSNTRFLDVNQMPDLNWQIRGVGDVDGDGRADLVWQNTATGALGVWLLNGTSVTRQQNLSIPRVSDTHWLIVGPR